MEKGFKKERHNPIELIKEFWPVAQIKHITYDQNLRKGQYDIIRQFGGDGTILFTIEMLQDALINIVNQHSYFGKEEPKDWSKVKGIKYIIGPMRHVTCFGMVWLKCSKTRKYPGQKERVRMPVICEIVT